MRSLKKDKITIGKDRNKKREIKIYNFYLKAKTSLNLSFFNHFPCLEEIYDELVKSSKSSKRNAFSSLLFSPLLFLVLEVFTIVFVGFKSKETFEKRGGQSVRGLWILIRAGFLRK